MKFIKKIQKFFPGSRKREAEERKDLASLALVQEMIGRLWKIELSKAESEEERARIRSKPIGIEMPEILIVQRRLNQI